MKKTKLLLIAMVISCMMFSAVACGREDGVTDDNYVTSGGERYSETTNRGTNTTETTTNKIVGGAGADAANTARDVGRDAVDTVEDVGRDVVDGVKDIGRDVTDGTENTTNDNRNVNSVTAGE